MDSKNYIYGVALLFTAGSALASGSIGNLIRDQLCGWFAEQA